MGRKKGKQKGAVMINTGKSTYTTTCTCTFTFTLTFTATSTAAATGRCSWLQAGPLLSGEDAYGRRGGGR